MSTLEGTRMSKGISSYPSWERQKVAKRRLAMPEAMRGMGYWAAVDAKVRMEEQKDETDKGTVVQG